MIANPKTLLLGASAQLGVYVAFFGSIFFGFTLKETVSIGIIAFTFSTVGGVLLAKLMNLFLKEKINPLIGSAGVSAVPMAARVSERVGLQADPKNHLLLHAMGPNVAGVIGTAVAAGMFLSLLK